MGDNLATIIAVGVPSHLDAFDLKVPVTPGKKKSEMILFAENWSVRC